MSKPIIHHTIETLHAHCDEVGNCWEWKRSFNNAGMPQTRHAGKVYGVRKLAYVLAGNEVKEGNVVFPSCKNQKCINPECTKQMSMNRFMTIKNLNRVKTLTTREKLSVFARSNSAKLTIEAVAEIRNSDKSGRQLARDHVVNLKTIWNAKNDRTWKEYRSPWSGLGGRA